MDLFLNLILIVISVALIILILIQSKGSGMGSLFGGGDSGVYTTRRGVEKTLFNLTVIISLTFFMIAIINVLISG